MRVGYSGLCSDRDQGDVLSQKGLQSGGIALGQLRSLREDGPAVTDTQKQVLAS